MSEAIRVLIVDDSILMRKALVGIVNAGRGFELAGTARDGQEALALIEVLKPDVISMDLEMPIMDGMSTLQEVMRRFPTPVVVCSSLSKRGADITMECLERGAVDFITKPDASTQGGLGSMQSEIWLKLRNAAKASLRPGVPTYRQSRFDLVIDRADQTGGGYQPTPAATPYHPVNTGNVTVPSVGIAGGEAVQHAQGQPSAQATQSAVPRHRAESRRAVVIGSSTGGPRVLMEILSALPGDLPAGVLVVQHMPKQFTQAMAQRLDAACALEVREAQAGDTVTDGVVLVAPGGYHMRLNGEGRVELNEEPAIWGVRPAADPLMEDVASRYGSHSLGVVLTGMGRDGTKGLGTIKARGGRTLAQDQSSCTIFGMPRAALEAGVVDDDLPPVEIHRSIRDWASEPLGSLARGRTT